MRASIIVAAHNEGERLWRTVASCSETCAGLDCEIVIADDASWDGSVEETLQRFPRVRVVRHEERRGASPTKDLGARHARGDVLIFLDGHTKPEPGAIRRLIEDVEQLRGEAVVTPAVAGLCTTRWKALRDQIGHGYGLELEHLDCRWLPLGDLREHPHRGRLFYESALIGCALAVHRELYDDLRGFDPHMLSWGVEDLDFGLKCWLMGHPILHDPQALIAHRFRQKFDNFDVPVEMLVHNQLRMARKNFTEGVWRDWVERCRHRNAGGLGEHPEGLWAAVWELFQSRRPSVESERSHLLSRRVRDEFWYAERFGLAWPRLTHEGFGKGADFEALAEPSASPSPAPTQKVNLVIHNGLAGFSGGQAISEADEEQKGAVTVANLNDTDGDGTVDKDDDEVAVTGANPPGRDEIDLMKLILNKPDPDDGGAATLSVASGDVKLWKESTKEHEFALSAGSAQVPTAELPMTLWVEARSPSTSPRDIVIKLAYKEAIDVVKATAVWVTATRVWFRHQAPDGFPENPVPGPGNDLTDLTKPVLQNHIEARRAVDGSRYGPGPFFALAGQNTAIGGRILWEFKLAPELTPADLDALRIKFDVTRQKKTRAWQLFVSQGTFAEIAEFTVDFPWEQTPRSDNEKPNDDSHTEGSQNNPVSNHLYSYDGPSRPISPTGAGAFVVDRSHFQEWVRMQVNNQEFPEDATNPEVHQSVYGSRCSPRYHWHLISYLRSQGGKWVQDASNPSACDPVYFGAMANGTMTVTLLADAVTEGFKAKYDKNNLKWTLEGTSNDPPVSAQVASAPQGTTWTITFGTKVRVVITQGATEFENDDLFAFSVFKSTVADAKQVKVGVGSINVTVGP